MSVEMVKIGDMPSGFMDVLIRAFSDYSVALGRVKNKERLEFTPLGTGVLVQKANRFGILTAHHCLHACKPEVRLGSERGDKLMLIIPRGRTVFFEPQELVEHRLVTPQSEEYGPDLAFIEILGLERLDTVKAIGSFWSLDQDARQVMAAFGVVGTPLAAVGYPEAYHATRVEGRITVRSVRHMTYHNAIEAGDVFERDGWDYLESTMDYSGSPDLPNSFAGVSGGPVWGMQLRKHKDDGHISIEKSALVDITFYQTATKNDKRRLRAHFIKSIYELAWMKTGF
jgi:hypothetical protein